MKPFVKPLFIIFAVLAMSLPLLAHAQGDQGKALYDNKGNYQGIAKPDPAGGYTIVNKQGEIVARVDSQGNVTDSQGRHKGRVKPAP